MNEQEEIIFKFNCIECNYHTNRSSFWLKHVDSQKHKRRGTLKTTLCEICNHQSFSHWNLKMHILSQHSTKDERISSKFYCGVCDQVFFCELYFDTHNKGIKHKNMIKAIEAQKQVDKEYKNNDSKCPI